MNLQLYGSKDWEPKVAIVFMLLKKILMNKVLFCVSLLA